ncbi:metallophosphoesterase [Sungkyunkwania multivorans]|uniref:Metallophosphoesterase n=1 Tax=Sungkyunkwania multivorans TaxID=1173618 RepID=A0ABW3CWL0_9FLAO
MSRFFIILAIIYLIGAFYSFQAFKTLVKNQWLYALYGLIFLGVLVNLYIQFSGYERGQAMTSAMSISMGVFLAFFTLGLFGGAFMLFEDIVRFLGWGYNKFTGTTNGSGGFLPSRRKFLSLTALGVAAIPFAGLLYGMYKGKYNFRVLKYTLHFEDLPEAFDGYQLTQISDIHSGSFDNKKKVEYAIDLINEQASDIILFTGDMVNNLASEMEPWKDTFGRLKARDGVYSILGNHDYGDYSDWNGDMEAKQQNLDRLKEIQKEMGFDLLLNETRFLEKDGQRLALIGVENWGAGRFKKAGDLDKALTPVSKEDFKILMSHDPSHWEMEVINHDAHIHLTLSGHTHGMQFGIEIPGWIKWSPVKWRYRYWAGIYKELDQYINVNRGFGYIGYPGRVGIWPEISVIELKKGSKTT